MMQNPSVFRCVVVKKTCSFSLRFCFSPVSAEKKPVLKETSPPDEEKKRYLAFSEYILVFRWTPRRFWSILRLQISMSAPDELQIQKCSTIQRERIGRHQWNPRGGFSFDVWRLRDEASSPALRDSLITPVYSTLRCMLSHAEMHEFNCSMKQTPSYNAPVCWNTLRALDLKVQTL